MVDYWKPSGTWKQRFRKALDDAFTDASLELLTSDYFPPENLFSKVAPGGLNMNFQERLMQLIDQARMNGWLLDLVVAAHERRPASPELTAIAEERGLTLSGPRMVNPTGMPLEAIIQANAPTMNLAKFVARLSILEGQVCRVEVPGGGGTGFLVGNDLVLTNWHVVEPLLSGKARWQDVRCRFDFKEDIDGGIPTFKASTLVALDEKQWLVDQHPFSKFDSDPKLGDAGADETDSALLRLAEAIGDSPVGGLTGDIKAGRRGWIDASSPAPAMAKGNQILLLQHPLGQPLQIAIGTVTGFNGSGTRIRYDANSQKGSSGSPCLNAELQVVALHHAYDPETPPKWNQAIPFSCIQEVWQKNHVKLA